METMRFQRRVTRVDFVPERARFCGAARQAHAIVTATDVYGKDGVTWRVEPVDAAPLVGQLVTVTVEVAE